MAKIACIGSRSLNQEQMQICDKLGQFIVRSGHELHTGGAVGADQSFAMGGNLVDPTKVHIHLPWKTYEQESICPGNIIHVVDDLPMGEKLDFIRQARAAHPAWERLSQGAQKLMIRNVMIIVPPPDFVPVDLTISWASNRQGGGGTGMGIRCSINNKVQVVDLNRYAKREDLYNLCETIRGMK